MLFVAWHYYLIRLKGISLPFWLRATRSKLRMSPGMVPDLVSVRTISGCAATFGPITKKVTLMPRFSNYGRISSG